MDFEFNQSETISANGVTPVRTAGDLLIQYDLSQGGTNPTLFLSRWVDALGCPAAECEASNSTAVLEREGEPDRGGRRHRVDQHLGHSRGGVRRAGRHLAAHVRRGAARLRRPYRRHGRVRLVRQRLPEEPLLGLLHLGAEGLHRPGDLNLNQCANVIIRKQTDPGGGPQHDRVRLHEGLRRPIPASANTFTLTDDGVKTYSRRAARHGLHRGRGCHPGRLGLRRASTASASTGVTPAISGATVTFDIDANADVLDCTYTNRARGDDHRREDHRRRIRAVRLHLEHADAVVRSP